MWKFLLWCLPICCWCYIKFTYNSDLIQLYRFNFAQYCTICYMILRLVFIGAMCKVANVLCIVFTTVSETCECETSSVTGVHYVAELCLWALLLGRRTASFWHHDSTVLWNCHVALHPLQPHPRHTSHGAASSSDCGFHGWLAANTLLLLCSTFVAEVYVTWLLLVDLSPVLHYHFLHMYAVLWSTCV